MLTVAERGARAAERTALTALVSPGWVARQGRAATGEGAGTGSRELVIVAPGPDAPAGRRVADAVYAELEAGLPAHVLTVAISRHADDPADLHRAGTEALLAANVAEARGLERLSFEETGAYRLLLPAMSEDPSELQGFFEETVAPLVDYDEQYETELVRTLESFLDADGNVARTAERLFTHRHTIRYRLERVRELSGLDVSSTDGRERLSLGLKAMRVLGIHPPGRPCPGEGRRSRPRATRAKGPLTDGPVVPSPGRSGEWSNWHARGLWLPKLRFESSLPSLDSVRRVWEHTFVSRAATDSLHGDRGS